MESVESETATLDRVDEEQQIIEWRFEQLRRAGFDPELALDLAISPAIDLHKATGLLRRGCPPDLAARILF
jgi:hypothetical protein